MATFFASHPSELRELAAFVEKEGWRARLALANEMIGNVREMENVCGKEPEDCCCFHRLEELVGVISVKRLSYVKQSNAGEDVFSPLGGDELDQVVDFEKRMNRFAHLCEKAQSEVFEVRVNTTEHGIIGTITYQPWPEGFNLSEAMSNR